MITVSIKPAKAYVNGKQMIATKFNVKSLNDNFYDCVTFHYTLLDENGVWAGEATHEVKTREDYIKWDFSATGAYKIVADAIGLEIVDAAPKLFEFEA